MKKSYKAFQSDLFISSAASALVFSAGPEVEGLDSAVPPLS